MTDIKRSIFWSKAEDIFIKRNAHQGVSLKDIAQMMQHRSLSSISNRARHLGVSKSELRRAKNRAAEGEFCRPLIPYAGHPERSYSRNTT